MTSIRVLGLALLAALVSGAAAPAQQPGAPRPAYSPYLNLLRPGGNAATNYYGLVRPQIDFRNQADALQQQINTNRAAIGVAAQVDPATGLPVTGHQTRFMNYGSYFPGAGGNHNAAPRPAVAAATPPQARGKSR
jgi:hypothetical protein